MTIPFEYPLKSLDIDFESPVCPVLVSHFSKYSTYIGGTGEFCCVPLLFFCHDLKIIPFFPDKWHEFPGKMGFKGWIC